MSGSVPKDAKRPRNAAFSACKSAIRWSTLGAGAATCSPCACCAASEQSVKAPDALSPATVPSGIQSCHPGGGAGQEGSGFQPFGGTHPAGGFGHSGGGLKTMEPRCFMTDGLRSVRPRQDRTGSLKRRRRVAPKSAQEPPPTVRTLGTTRAQRLQSQMAHRSAAL